MRLAFWLLLLAALIGVAAPAHAWDQFQIIEWQARNEAQLVTLKRLGITAATVIAKRDDSGTPAEQQYAPMLAAGLRWYIENIATDYYSAYHRWFPGRPVNWRFVEAQHRYQQNPDDKSLLWRDPSFVDPVWQQRIRDRLMTIVAEEKRYDPLYYSLGDETGIADLSAFWDFDLSPGSLAAMRVWLRQNYGTLAALNGEWGTHFTRWDEVRPETTRQAMRRTDDNFAAWADFKAWMDVSFARALRMGTDAVHRADPAALSGMEGVQVPGWGGYDYSLLVHAVDAMEGYDLPLAHSLNPRLTLLSTSFSATPGDLHNIWQGLLEGGRGLILWDEDYSIVRQDATLGDRGKDYAATFAEIRGPIGTLLLASEPHVDPVAILYSPSSFRTQWMLEQKPKGDAWMTRDSEAEVGPNAARDAMWAYERAVTHLGLQPAYLSPAMIEEGALRKRGIRTLILPHVIALSAAEARAIGDFAALGGRVIADVQPGSFDGHSRRLVQPFLKSTLFRILPPEALRAELVGVVPPVRVEAPNHDVTTHIFRHGATMVVAIQRDFAQASTDEAVVVTLPKPGTLSDLRSGHSLGRNDRVTVMLDTVSPAVLSISP